MWNRHHDTRWRESGDNLICLVHDGDLSGAAFIDELVGIGIDRNGGEIRNAVVAWLAIDDEKVSWRSHESGGSGNAGCRDRRDNCAGQGDMENLQD